MQHLMSGGESPGGEGVEQGREESMRQKGVMKVELRKNLRPRLRQIGPLLIACKITGKYDR